MVEKESILDNIEIHKNFLVVSVNPKFYPLSVIYSAAYALLDKVHVIIDGDPNSEVMVELRPKNQELAAEKELKEIGYRFNDELINYSIYTIQAARTKKIREALIQSALQGNTGAPPGAKRNPPQQPAPKKPPSQSIPPQFPHPPPNQPSNPSPPPPKQKDQIPDPLGIRKVKTPEEDNEEIPDPEGIMKDNVKKDCGSDS